MMMLESVRVPWFSQNTTLDSKGGPAHIAMEPSIGIACTPYQNPRVSKEERSAVITLIRVMWPHDPCHMWVFNAENRTW